MSSHSVNLRAVEGGKSKTVTDCASETVNVENDGRRNTGMTFERVAKQRCPLCNGLVTLQDKEPLSMSQCPQCGGMIMVAGRIDNFVLNAHIGEGEMGAIFKATDQSLDREVAVKIVRTSLADDPAQRERLRREACAAGKLNHPRVAQVYALNFSNGNPYLVMELVSGLDFHARLEKEGPLDERCVLRMALDVAEGLSALHREGLVHGDIKPANIVLDRDGNAKLVDFGLSGMMRHDGHGNLVGTPHYLAPEILKGNADSHRTDIYSLGGTLYFLLSGRLPFDGDTPATILKARLSSDPMPLHNFAPDVSDATCAIIMRMLEHEPQNRYADSDRLADEIRDVLHKLDHPLAVGDNTPTHPPADNEQVRDWRFWKDWRASTLRASLLSVILIALLGAALHQNAFQKTRDWIHDDLGGWIAEIIADMKTRTGERKARQLYEWSSVTVGDFKQRASTMQSGDIIILQCRGSDMWLGRENYRFHQMECKQNYALSAQVLEIAANNEYDISGVMVKNQRSDDRSALLFAFLGDGRLCLQHRRRDESNVVIRCEREGIKVPIFLKIQRIERNFTAFTSHDGNQWHEFSACEADIGAVNSVGVVVSSQKPGNVASAKFSTLALQFESENLAE